MSADRDRFPRGLREMAASSQHASQTVFLEECAQVLEGLHGRVDRYRYVANYAGADSWDCGPELIARLQWAKGADVGGELAANRVAELAQEFYACTARPPREPGDKSELIQAIEAFRDAFAPPDEDMPAHDTEQWAALERLDRALVATRDGNWIPRRDALEVAIFCAGHTRASPCEVGCHCCLHFDAVLELAGVPPAERG